MTQLTKTTPSNKPKKTVRTWHFVDASGKILGRLATGVATFLIGKHKSDYSPESDCGDYVVVLNSVNVKLSGNKAEQKEYTRYSGYPGGLKKVTLKQAQNEKPNFVVRNAIWGMLPKNKLRKVRVRRLYIYEGDTHPHMMHVSS